MDFSRFMTPDITILCPDLRSPSLGAAVRLRELLAPWAVEIVGPDFGGGICSMYRQAGPFTVVPTRKLYRWPDFVWESRKLERAARGRVVIAVKAYMNTVSVALRLQRRGQARAVVFLDEWDGSALAGLTAGQRLGRFVRQAHLPLEDSYYPIVERQLVEASLVLSTTHALQRRFGGEVIAMGVDTRRFCPQPAELVGRLRRELGLEGRKVVVFGGVVRPHKGVEDILEAMVQCGRDDLALVVAGPLTEHVELLRAQPRYRSLVVMAGAPLSDDPGGVNRAVSERLPLYLDLADVMMLPLQDTPLAQSQMPIKIFEAMAMGKPIIATAVADLPRVLEGCGVVTAPGDAPGLAAALGGLLADPVRAARLGRATRERCEQFFSREAAGAHLRGLVEPLLVRGAQS